MAEKILSSASGSFKTNLYGSSSRKRKSPSSDIECPGSDLGWQQNTPHFGLSKQVHGKPVDLPQQKKLEHEGQGYKCLNPSEISENRQRNNVNFVQRETESMGMLSRSMGHELYKVAAVEGEKQVLVERRSEIGASMYVVEGGKQKPLHIVQGGSSSFGVPLERRSDIAKGFGKSFITKKLTDDVCVSSMDKSISDCGTGKLVNLNNLDHAPPKVGEKSSLSSRKTTPVFAEKLWEGSIQLNSSITMSGVAFFKSGERLIDTNWSEILEVKGKVRLDDFEKYIQDLPRAGTRGLTVISVCAKEGSSERGLKGIKEICKRYLENDRVGFVQLSTGVQLYLCPRRQKIIEILTEYGLPEGLADVEDNLESFIGCVVWRRNLYPELAANRSIAKVDSLPGHLQKAPADTSSNQEEKRNLLPATHVQNTVARASMKSSSALEAGSIAGSKDCQIQRPIRGESLRTTSAEFPIPVKEDSTFRRAPIQHSQEQKSEGTLRFSEAKQSVQGENRLTACNVTKHMTSIWDDDLPEFDFESARGFSFSSAGTSHDSSVLKKTLLPEGILKDGLVAQTIPSAHSASTDKSDALIIPRLASTSDVVGHGQISPNSWNTGGCKTCGRSPPPTISPCISGKRKAICYGDEVPQWYPWEQTHSVAESNRQSAFRASAPSGSSNVRFQQSAVRIMEPQLSYAATTRPGVPPQPFPPLYPPPNHPRVPPSVLPQDCSTAQSTCLRPSSGKNFQGPPPRPTYHPGWRP